MLYRLSSDSRLHRLNVRFTRPQARQEITMSRRFSRAQARLCAALALSVIPPVAARAQAANVANQGATPSSQALSPLSYADLADLVVPADLVARAQVRKVARLKPDQALDVPSGKMRVYIEARTTALLAGPDMGESIRFLTDVPLDSRGRLPRLSKADILVLGHTVPGKPGDLLLAAPDAMLPFTPATEQRLRAILTEKLSPDAPPAIRGVREALHVPGNLAGEGETQVFLATDGAKPASLSIVRRPEQPVSWGVSFSEIVDQSARPPAPDTLAWYRLACSLPPELPVGANISGSSEDQATAVADYAVVIAGLGPCTRTRAH